MSESEQAIYLFLDKNPFSRLSDLWRIFPDMPKGTLALCFSKWMDKMRAQQQRQLKEILANQDEPLSNPLNRHLEKEDLPSGDSLNSATTTKSAESLKSKQAGTPIQTRKSETDSIEADQAENTNKTLDNAKKQLRDNSDQDNSSSRIPKANLPPAVAKNKPFFLFLLEHQNELQGLIRLFQKSGSLPNSPAFNDIEITNTKKRTYEINQDVYKQFTKSCKNLKITQKKAINLAMLDFIHRHKSN